MKEEVGLSGGIEAEVLALKHESRILGQWYNTVRGSKKGLTCSIIEKPHTVLDDFPRILL